MAARAGGERLRSVAAPATRPGARDALEAWLAHGLIAAARRGRWPQNLGAGARLGEIAHALGIRRRVAEANLRLAFPELANVKRARLLLEHYRELGRVCMEYARLGELATAPEGQVVANIEGVEHLLRARESGRGAILLTGHFGNFELLGASLGRYNPVDFVVKELSNPKMEAWIAAERRAAGVGLIPTGAGIRGVLTALQANRWIAMLADQDARRHGTFVPFFGRPASTPVGPAAIALRTGAPILMGFDRRLPDGRHVLTVEPPVTIEHPGRPDAAQRLTAAHTARLEARIREQPSLWFWLHRRWKTAPPQTS